MDCVVDNPVAGASRDVMATGAVHIVTTVVYTRRVIRGTEVQVPGNDITLLWSLQLIAPLSHTPFHVQSVLADAAVLHNASGCVKQFDRILRGVQSRCQLRTLTR